MKRTLFAFLTLAGLCLFGIDVSAIDLSQLTDQVVTVGHTVLFGDYSDGVSYAASLLAIKSADPEMWRKWTESVFKLGEAKTEFNESEIGYTYADDGPKPSDAVKAPPILSETKLETGGRYMSIKVKKPLFTDAKEIIMKGRYQGQSREGAEFQLQRDAVKVCVDELHIGLSEKEIESGEQSTANMQPSELMAHFRDGISDHFIQRKDWGIFWTLGAGSDAHHYINAGLRNNVANGGVPVADPEMGLHFAMMEHPNSYVYHVNGGATANHYKVAYSATMATYSGNFTTEIDKVTPAAKPDLAWLRKVNRVAINSNMIPCQIRMENGKLHKYYLLYVPGRVKDLLEEDDAYQKVMNSAYQGMVKDNPMLHAGDVAYKSLIIRESQKLDEEYMSLKYSFNAEGDGGSVGDAAFNKITVNGHEWADIDLGERVFTAATAAATAYGASDACNNLGRSYLLGANAVIRAQGLKFDLVPDTREYESEQGLGLTTIFGQHTNKQFDPVTGGFSQAPQSIQFITHAGW